MNRFIPVLVKIGYVALIGTLVALVGVLAPRMHRALTSGPADLELPTWAILMCHGFVFGLPLLLAAYFVTVASRPIMAPEHQETLAELMTRSSASALADVVGTKGDAGIEVIRADLDQIRAVCPSCGTPYTTMPDESAACPQCSTVVAAGKHRAQS